jgi:hypothetical protein
VRQESRCLVALSVRYRAHAGRDVPCPPPLRRHWPWVNNSRNCKIPHRKARRVPFIQCACCLAKAYDGWHLQSPVGTRTGSCGANGISFSVSALSHRGHESGQDLPAFRPITFSDQHSYSDDNRPVLGRILPIVNTGDWVERLCSVSPGEVTDIQLRIKDETDPRKSWRLCSESDCVCGGWYKAVDQ